MDCNIMGFPAGFHVYFCEYFPYRKSTLEKSLIAISKLSDWYNNTMENLK